MNTFQRVFVAIDFSPGSNEALRQAHSRAHSTGATLAVCHIVPNELRSNLLFPQLTQDAVLKIPSELKRAAEAASARVKEVTGRADGEFELIVDHGTPYAEILTKAEDWAADLIVAGSHGMTSTAGMLLGSVTHKIIRHAHCAVLIARPGKGAGRIVAGTDFSDPALLAVNAAADEARRTGSELTVVHSLDYITPVGAEAALAYQGAQPGLSAEELERMTADARDRLDEALDDLGIKGQTRVAHGPADKALIQIAAELQADLLVVGTLGRTGFRRVLLGSVAEAVARHAPCSVLIVRQHPQWSSSAIKGVTLSVITMMFIAIRGYFLRLHS